jgi:WhiB family transcriptional regulator, redox-sensing transcriptional regulator
MLDASWMEQAACRHEGNELFFPTDVGTSNSMHKVARERYCNGCPVKRQCLEFAIRLDIDHGLWGGASERQRREMRRERRLLVRRREAS